MFSVCFCLLIVLCVSFALGQIANRRIEECVPVILTGTIVILYIFYCLNILLIGRILVYVLFAVLIVMAVLSLTGKITVGQQKKADTSDIIGFVFNKFLTPGIVLLIGISILFLIYASNLNPSVWDELRLWAAMPKAIHFTEVLQVGEGSLLYSTMQSYPPGMALFVYFFSAFSGSFSYSSIFALYWIFMAALVLPALKHLTWRQWYVLPIVFFVLIVIPVLLTVNGNDASGDWNFFFTSLYIDPMLGCLMGYAFYQAIKDPAKSAFSLIGFSLALFILPSFKNLGAMYAAVALLMAFAVRLLKYREVKNGVLKQDTDNPSSETQNSGNTLKRGVLLVIPLLSIAVSYFSWQLIINTKGTGEFIDFSLSSFTWDRFVNVIKGMATWGHIPFLFYALFFILFGLFMIFVLKDIPRKIYLVGAAGFLAAFLIFFYGYTSHYGLMLSSIHRYTSTFTFAAFIYLLMRFFARLNPKAVFTFRGKIIEDNYQEFRADHAADDDELKEIEEEERRWTDAGLYTSVPVNTAKTEEGLNKMIPGDKTNADAGPDAAQSKEMTRAEARAISKRVLLNILPSKPVNAGRLLFIELLLMLVAVLLLFNSRTYQLKNESMKDAGAVIAQAEDSIRNNLDAETIPQSEPQVTIMIKDASVKQYDAKHPAKCYLALGGDTRKQSQRHETYALEAIGSSINIQSIWCDKLFNEAEDGVVTSKEEMTRIWAKNLLEKEYEYVLISQADEDILYAVSQIAPEAGVTQIGENCVLRVIPASNPFGITFIRQ